MTGAFPLSGAQYTPYSGPCDHVTCAEAWSVTHALVSTYSGKLFQLNNGSSTLDIGQTSKHAADMSTWSAFCSGVASNCTISKVYAQVHTGSNDLTPFNNTVGGRAVFTIEAATGLPLFVSVGTSATQSLDQQYTIGGSSDNVSTGITAGGTAETVMMNIKPVAQTGGWCCGMFGTSHLWSVCCTGGTSFQIGIAQGNVAISNGGFCRASYTWCITADLEAQTGCTGFACFPGAVGIDYSALQFGGTIGTQTYDPVANKLAMYVNGVQLFNNPILNFTMNSGTRIHYGGGGDLGGPMIVESRDLLIFNATLSQTQVSVVTNNLIAFYPTVSFPTGPAQAVSYTGPGDVVSGATYYNGFRAYSAAIAAGGTQQLFSVQNVDSGDQCGVIVAPNGGPGSTASCTQNTENGQTVNNFCSHNYLADDGSHNQPYAPGNRCYVTEVNDQVGNVANYGSVGSPHDILYEPYCINFTPCALWPPSASDELGGNITLSAVSQPYTAIVLGARLGNTSVGYAITHEGSSGGSGTPSFYTGWTGSANQVFMKTNTSLAFPSFTATAADNLFHTIYNIFNAAASSIVVDGTSTTGTVGSDAAGANPAIRWGNVSFAGGILQGGIAETGLYPFALTSTQLANLRANQKTYWGF